MPDITMCTGERADAQCPVRNDCWRYTATPSKMLQSYFVTAPFTDEGCLYQITLQPRSAR